MVESQAVDCQWSEHVTWPESPLGKGAGSVPRKLPRAPAQPLFLSQVAQVAEECLSGLWGADDPEALGRRIRPQEGLLCSESAGCQGGWDTLAACLSDLMPLVVHGQAGFPGHTIEECMEGLSCWAEDSLCREPLPKEHLATGHQPLGSCSNLLGTERDNAVALVFTQLTRRILLDSMAVLAPGDSL